MQAGCPLRFAASRRRVATLNQSPVASRRCGLFDAIVPHGDRPLADVTASSTIRGTAGRARSGHVPEGAADDVFDLGGLERLRDDANVRLGEAAVSGVDVPIPSPAEPTSPV